MRSPAPSWCQAGILSPEKRRISGIVFPKFYRISGITFPKNYRIYGIYILQKKEGGRETSGRRYILFTVRCPRRLRNRMIGRSLLDVHLGRVFVPPDIADLLADLERIHAVERSDIRHVAVVPRSEPVFRHLGKQPLTRILGGNALQDIGKGRGIALLAGRINSGLRVADLLDPVKDFLRGQAVQIGDGVIGIHGIEQDHVQAVGELHLSVIARNGLHDLAGGQVVFLHGGAVDLLGAGGGKAERHDAERGERESAENHHRIPF